MSNKESKKKKKKKKRDKRYIILCAHMNMNTPTEWKTEWYFSVPLSVLFFLFIHLPIPLRCQTSEINILIYLGSCIWSTVGNVSTAQFAVLYSNWSKRIFGPQALAKRLKIWNWAKYPTVLGQ